MSVIKRGKLAIFSLTLMVMIAGYINYKYDAVREKDLGKTVFVNGSEVYLYQNDNTVDIYTEQNNNVSVNNFAKYNVTNIKLSRDDMYSELINTYTQALQAVSINDEIKGEYQSKLDNIIKEKYQIKISEETAKSYDIDEIAFVVNNGEMQVYVSNDTKLTNTQVLAIQTLAKNNFNIEHKNTTIWENK